MLRDLAKYPLQEPREVFVLSGSTAADDANQWRLYAQGGRGYALEFDPTVELVAVTKGEPLKPPKPRKGRIALGWDWSDSVTVTPWLHVLYDPAEVAVALAELVRTTTPALAGLSRTSFEEHETERSELQGDLYEALALIAHLTKAPGFEGEREVRVVTTYLFESQHIQFRSGPYGIVSYGLLTRAPKGHASGRILRSPKLVQGKRPGKQLPITSVRLGPLLQPEHESTVRSFLTKNKLPKVAVLPSAVPLR